MQLKIFCARLADRLPPAIGLAKRIRPSPGPGGRGVTLEPNARHQPFGPVALQAVSEAAGLPAGGSNVGVWFGLLEVGCGIFTRLNALNRSDRTSKCQRFSVM